MRRTHTRIAGAIAALVAAAVAGFTLRPAPKPTVVLAARPAEIRTQVIHRTIHIVRHKHAKVHHLRPAAAAAAGGAAAASAYGAPRTSTSHHTGVVGASAPVTTGSSHLASAVTGSPVTTRTSAGHGTTSGGSVTTRSSKSGGGSVTTRSSGGGEKGDGGGDGGGD